MRAFVCAVAVALAAAGASALAGEPVRPPARPVEPLRLSVEAAERLALERSDLMVAAHYDVRAMDGAVMSARSVALPSLSLEGYFNRQSYGHLFGSSPTGSLFSGSGPVPSRSATSDFYRLDLVVRQLLYQGSLIPSSIRAARLARELALVRLEAVSEGAAFSAKSSYYGVLIAREMVRVAEVSLELASRHAKDAESLRDAGMATDFEVLSAGVRRSAADAYLAGARGALSIAEAGMRRALALDLSAPVELTDVLAHREISVSEESLVAEATRSRADVKMARMSVEAAEILVALARAEMMPSIGVSASAGGGAEKHLTRESNFDNDWTVGVQLTAPIFDGMSARGRIIEESAKLDRARSELEATGRDVRLDVRQAVVALSTAEERVRSQAAGVAEAERAYELARARWQAGAAKQLDVFDAGASLAEAKRRHAGALYAHAMAVANIERVSGRCGEKAPPEPETAPPGRSPGLIEPQPGP